MTEQRLVKIALGQFVVAQGDTEHNLSKMLQMTDEAAAQGADIIAFPELAYTGYGLKALELQKLAEPADGRFVQALCRKAKEKHIHIYAGYAESERIPGKLYNAAVFIDDEGRVLENLRKVYLWGKEKTLFSAGHRYPVIETRFGRVGLLICYDLEYPEPARIECLKGAEMILDIAAWSLPAERRWHVDMAANALFNLLFSVGCTSLGQNFCGHSKIVGPDGVVRAEASATEEELLVAEIDLAEVLRVRSRIPYITDFKADTFTMDALNTY